MSIFFFSFSSVGSLMNNELFYQMKNPRRRKKKKKILGFNFTLMLMLCVCVQGRNRPRRWYVPADIFSSFLFFLLLKGENVNKWKNEDRRIDFHGRCWHWYPPAIWLFLFQSNLIPRKWKKKKKTTCRRRDDNNPHTHICISDSDVTTFLVVVVEPRTGNRRRSTSKNRKKQVEIGEKIVCVCVTRHTTTTTKRGAVLLLRIGKNLETFQSGQKLLRLFRCVVMDDVQWWKSSPTHTPERLLYNNNWPASPTKFLPRTSPPI